MIDVDPRLDTRLRTFYEHIEDQSSSRDLAAFTPPAHARRRNINLVAGVAAAAVVAAGIAVFAIELQQRHDATPSPAATPSVTLPSASAMSAPLPTDSHTVIPAKRGRGSATLQTFTAEGLVFIEYACVGEGSVGIGSTSSGSGSTNDQVAEDVPCARDGSDAPVWGTIFPAIAPIGGEPLTLRVSAGPATAWEVVVADGGPPLPSLGFSSAPAGSRVLIEGLYGTGTSAIGTFSPTGPLHILYACAGIGTIDFAAASGVRSVVADGPCANGTVGSALLSTSSADGPVHLSVGTVTKTLWEIVVYESPGPKT
jgi:hypothetical protein